MKKKSKLERMWERKWERICDRQGSPPQIFKICGREFEMIPFDENGKVEKWYPWLRQRAEQLGTILTPEEVNLLLNKFGPAESVVLPLNWEEGGATVFVFRKQDVRARCSPEECISWVNRTTRMIRAVR